MKYVRLGTTALMVLTSACASTRPPHERVASSQAAIRSADELGASKAPQASVYLQLARDEFEKARALMRAGDNHEATALLMRAQADADLALALSREARTHAAAEEAVARVQVLRGETGSAIGGGPTTTPSPTPSPPPSTPSPAPSTPESAPSTSPPGGSNQEPAPSGTSR
jgi:hypothetical protein